MMSSDERERLQNALRMLRSGDKWREREAEEILAKMAGLDTTTCSCPNYPEGLGVNCFAHPILSMKLARLRELI
jgi:hypothetical protein